MSVMLPHRVLARSLVALLTNPSFKCTRLITPKTLFYFTFPTEISSPGMIRNWRNAFETGGIVAPQPRKKGRPSYEKRPAEGSVEALRTENERFRMENAYLKK
jgi:hypothetical protein